MNHTQFLQRAIDLAYENVLTNKGGPFGAVVIKDDVIIAEGTNLVTSKHDPTAHAEVVAIRNACTILNNFQLTDCVVYSSCEPCPMCLGALFWARPRAVYFAAYAQDAAHVGFDDAFMYVEMQKKHEDRSLPFYHLRHEDSLKSFKAWSAHTAKVKY